MGSEVCIRDREKDQLAIMQSYKLYHTILWRVSGQLTDNIFMDGMLQCVVKEKLYKENLSIAIG